MTRLLVAAPLKGVVTPVMVVTGDAMTAATLERELTVLGSPVRRAETVEEAAAALDTGAYAVALVDTGLQGGAGFDLVRQARRADQSVGLCLFSWRDDVGARVYGLECGADDCLTLPVHGDELRARVKALLRRTPPPAPKGTRVVLGSCWFDLDTRLGHTRDGEVVLSSREVLLLRAFIEREGEVLSRDQLLDAGWGLEASPSDRTIDNFIVRLRRYFEPDPSQPRFLLTVRGRGYLLRRQHAAVESPGGTPAATPAHRPRASPGSAEAPCFR